MRVAREQTADGPRKCAAKQRDEGEQHSPIADERVVERGPQQSCEACEADEQSKPSAQRQRFAVGQEELNERDVKRHDRKAKR